MKKRILVVEDEDKLRRILELQLLDSGFDVVKASSAEEGLPLIDRSDLILTDFKLPGMTGLEMLQLVRRQDSHVPVIVMTAFGTVENAVEAMKAGAVDFLMKPFSLDHLTMVVNKALEVRNLRDENRRLKEELGRKYQWDNIVGRSTGDAADLRDDHAGGADARHGAAGRGERRRQRSDRARHPFSFAAQGQAVR